METLRSIVAEITKLREELEADLNRSQSEMLSNILPPVSENQSEDSELEVFNLSILW